MDWWTVWKAYAIFACAVLVPMLLLLIVAFWYGVAMALREGAFW